MPHHSWSTAHSAQVYCQDLLTPPSTLKFLFLFTREEVVGQSWVSSVERNLTTTVDSSFEFSSEYSGLSESLRVCYEFNLQLALTAIPEYWKR